MDSERSYQQFGQNSLGRPPQGPLAKLIAFVLSAGFLILAFMFSLVALAVVAVVGIVLGGWLWWRTRKLRQEINRQRADQWRGGEEQSPFSPSADRSSTVIDGEAVRVSEETASGPAHRLER